MVVQGDLLIPDSFVEPVIYANLEVSGNILVQPGADLEIAGDCRVGGSVMSFRSVSVEGGLDVGGDLDCSEHVYAGGNIHVQRVLEADGYVDCEGDLAAQLCRAASLEASGKVTSALVLSEECMVGGSVISDDIVIAGRIKVGGDLSVGYYIYTTMGDIEVGGNLEAFHVTAAQNINVAGDMNCRGSILAGAFPPTRLESDDNLAQIRCARLVRGKVILGELIEASTAH
jgi:cytoskeletal protein CcmA (bactofilin family)